MNRKRLYTLGPPRPPDVPEPFPEPPSLWTMVKPHLGKFYHRFKTAILVASGILITLLALLFYDLAKPDPERLTRQDVKNEIDLALEEQPPDPSYASLAYEIIHPSVVFIQSQTGESSDTGEGALGSGVVIVDSGIILTCLHVVKDASAINVIFADGSVSEAEVIVRQPENDLAVLQARIIPDDLIPATMADSASLNVGDEVAVVGHPFGIRNSLSAGVVSGLRRNYESRETGETLTDLIQFDAAANPGNSGGPLVNRNGEVVGIVTAIVNPVEMEFFVGIGFAVPIETAAGAAGEPLW